MLCCYDLPIFSSKLYSPQYKYIWKNSISNVFVLFIFVILDTSTSKLLFFHRRIIFSISQNVYWYSYFKSKPSNKNFLCYDCFKYENNLKSIHTFVALVVYEVDYTMVWIWLIQDQLADVYPKYDYENYLCMDVVVIVNSSLILKLVCTLNFAMNYFQI